MTEDLATFFYPLATPAELDLLEMMGESIPPMARARAVPMPSGRVVLEADVIAAEAAKPLPKRERRGIVKTEQPHRKPEPRVLRNKLPQPVESDLGEWWPGIRFAADYLGIGYSTVRDRCADRRPTKGRVLRYSPHKTRPERMTPAA